MIKNEYEFRLPLHPYVEYSFQIESPLYSLQDRHPTLSPSSPIKYKSVALRFIFNNTIGN